MENKPKKNMQRRDFIKGSLALGASTLFMNSLFARALSQLEGPADLVVRNAKVTTINPKAPRAEAFAIKNG
ncbi:MAG: twin-arginine translocation signal domain-containing protein, partial [Bacteroidota bacterium]